MKVGHGNIPAQRKRRKARLAARGIRQDGNRVAQRQRRVERARAAIAAAKDSPCVDCGNKYPPHVMDFDHREGEEKKRAVSKMTMFSAATIMREIAKCDLVCANCHRERTYRRSLR